MGILQGSCLKQNMGIMLIFFFKLNVNFPQLLYLLALEVINGIFEGFAFGVYSPNRQFLKTSLS